MKKFASFLIILSVLLCVSCPLFAADKEIPANGGDTGSGAPSANSGPALIVTKFTCGGDSITAGKVFTLTYTLYNTSKSMAVQNVVVKVNGGETFALNKDSDTYYVERIKAKGAVEHSDEFVSKGDAVDGSYPMTITATYDYYEDGAKLQGSSEVKISIPVTQDNRVRIVNASVGGTDDAGEPIPVYVGEENAVEYDFINTGFSKLLNTEISVYNAENNEMVDNAYLGTINPSTQMKGSNYLNLNFGSAGKKQMRFVITYEDSHLNKQTVEFPFTVNVEKPMPVEEIPEDQGGGGFLWIGTGIILLVIAGVVAFIVIRRKKKKKLASDESLWDDEDDDDEFETEFEAETEEKTEDSPTLKEEEK